MPVSSTLSIQVPKGGVEIKPAQVKQHLFLFINSLIENPAFDSQTKENMTLKKREFKISFFHVLPFGIIKLLLTWSHEVR